MIMIASHSACIISSMIAIVAYYKVENLFSQGLPNLVL